MKKKCVLTVLFLFGMGVLVSSCVTTPVKPTESNFKDPIISLESFMVPQFDGYWYYGGNIKPTKGAAGDHGAPLPMTFLFEVENPNPYPILLEGVKFTVGFDEFDLVTVNNEDSYWIPAGKTDQVRATTLITVRSGLLSLLVTGGFKLKEKGISPWQALEGWWKGVPDYSTPVSVKEGAFNFIAGDMVKVLPFEATIP